MKPETKAIALMQDVLGEEETSRYLSTGKVHVTGGITGHEYVVGQTLTWRCDSEGVWGYCVDVAGSNPVFWAVAGAFLELFGITLKQGFPNADRVLTLALWIRGREDEFMLIANRVAAR